MNQILPAASAVVALLGVIAVYAKLRPEVRSIDTRTASDQQALDERRRADQAAAEQRLADSMNEMVTNLTAAYTSLLETVNRAHDKVVDGMKQELSDVRDRLAHVEDLLMQERSTTVVLNETITGLNATIGRLNDAVSERDATIRRIRDRLNHTTGVNADEVIAPTLAPERRSNTHE